MTKILTLDISAKHTGVCVVDAKGKELCYEAKEFGETQEELSINFTTWLEEMLDKIQPDIFAFENNTRITMGRFPQTVQYFILATPWLVYSILLKPKYKHIHTYDISNTNLTQFSRQEVQKVYGKEHTFIRPKTTIATVGPKKGQVVPNKKKCEITPEILELLNLKLNQKKLSWQKPNVKKAVSVLHYNINHDVKTKNDNIADAYAILKWVQGVQGD